MNLKQIWIDLFKLILCGAVFFLGTMIGGAVAAFMNLPSLLPPMGANIRMIELYLILTAPLIALASALLARGLGGGLVTRAAILSFLIWIAYTVNTQLEASIFSVYVAGFWTAVVSALFPSLLCGTAVAYLFPADIKGEDLDVACEKFFGRYTISSWAWRLIIGAILFAPIYFVFGLLVTPFTLEYYRQNMFGLELPTIDRILPILFLRSLLFLLACLPVIIMWQKSARGLFIRLGSALYILVGLVYMLSSTWLPLYVRFPHALEILADEFAYASLLVLLLARRNVSANRTR